LSNIRKAMKPGYTKLLIHDKIIPARGAVSEATGFDLTMMIMFGSQERTYSDWTRLFDAAGLVQIGAWPERGMPECILECIVRDDINSKVAH
jgi:hypothetical protein